MVSWTAVGSIAGIITAAITLSQYIRVSRRRRRMRVFLSIQMSQLTGEQYAQTRSEAMELVSVLRRKDDVYFLNESIPRLEDFQEELFNARDYLDEIRRADHFVAIVTDRVLSSIYFEAGFALALGKPCTYFVTKLSVMPLLMRLLGSDYPGIKVVQAQSLAEITPRISQLMEHERTRRKSQHAPN